MRVGELPARAILLAAGRGERLGELGATTPKCLLSFAGRTLLERHLAALTAGGVEEIAIVTGYRHGAVVDELDRLGHLPAPYTLYNPDFERGSIVSLWSGREPLARGGDVLLMDADVLYDPLVLEPLLRARHSSLLLDRDYDDAGGEAVKICVRDGCIVEFRKQLPPDLRFDFAGESVGFFRLHESDARQLAERAQEFVSAGRVDEPFEDALRDLLLESPESFQAQEVTGLPWLEIDFPEDVRRASAEILPRLEAQGDRRLGKAGRR